MQRKVCNTADNMAKITVQNTQITVIKQNEDDYISLTDMLKAKDGEFFFSNWLRNRNTIEFLGIWERLMNPNFNCAEFDIIKSQAGLNRFRLSAKEWTEKTNAIGIISKAGRKAFGDASETDAESVSRHFFVRLGKFNALGGHISA